LGAAEKTPHGLVSGSIGWPIDLRWAADADGKRRQLDGRRDEKVIALE
jgi:hypothetical protein